MLSCKILFYLVPPIFLNHVYKALFCWIVSAISTFFFQSPNHVSITTICWYLPAVSWFYEFSTLMKKPVFCCCPPAESYFSCFNFYQVSLQTHILLERFCKILFFWSYLFIDSGINHGRLPAFCCIPSAYSHFSLPLRFIYSSTTINSMKAS